MKVKDERGCIIDVSEEEAIQRLRKRNAEDKVKYIVDNIICDRNQTAIAELEKVKTLFKEEFKDKWVEDCGIDYCEWSNYDTAINIIDQQITELEGGK